MNLRAAKQLSLTGLILSLAVVALYLAGGFCPTHDWSSTRKDAFITSTKFRGQNTKDKIVTTAKSAPAEPINHAALITALFRDWENLDEPNEREARIAEMETLLTSADLASLTRTLPPDTINFALGLPSFKNWLIHFPETAIAILSTRPEISEAHLRTAFDAWHEQASEQFAQYLRELAPSPWREKSIGLACLQMITTNPAEAAAWAGLLEASPRQTGLLEQVAIAWSMKDPLAAVHWAEQINDPESTERIYAAMAVARAEQDPEQAVRWLLQSVRPGVIRDQAQVDLAAVWAATEPARIAAWVERFPEGEYRQTAMRSLVTIWGNLDHHSAAAWIARLPAGPQRDEIQSQFENLPVLSLSTANQATTQPRSLLPR